MEETYKDIIYFLLNAIEDEHLGLYNDYINIIEEKFGVKL